MTDQEPSTPFRGIDHIGIAVHDLDTAITLYTEVFGLTLLRVEDNPQQGVREAMLAPASAEGSVVQLVAPLGPDSPVASFLAERKPGLHHLAFAVDDLDEAATFLRTRGVDVIEEEAGIGTGNTRVNFVHPRLAGGVLLELVAPPEPEAAARSSS